MARRGFTLVETLVALAITAVLLIALAAATTTALRTRAGATARAARTAVERGVVRRLAGELATTQPLPFALASTPASLRFTGGPEPGEEIRYAVERGALVRCATPRFALDAAAGPPVALADGVDGLELAAWDGATWRASWNGEPPPAVRIRLRFADGAVLDAVARIATGRGRSAD